MSEITPAFKLIFFTVLGLSVGCLVADVIVSVTVDMPNDQVNNVIETLSTAWKTGFGAIVGLIGGKAV